MPPDARMPDPELEPFVDVERAAAVLGIGRTLAFEQARLFERTGGTEGLPVIRWGRLLRVPSAALVSLANTGLQPGNVSSILEARPRRVS